MKRASRYRLALIIAGMGVLVASPLPSQASEPPPAGWKLVWSDEFDGQDIDRTKWDFEIGNGFFHYGANVWVGGWGNNELQYYTREPENAHVQGGMLHIRAVKETLREFGYTSARLKSQKRDGSPLFSQRYGRFEFRAKLPTGKGLWPALWMRAQDEKYGTWAASGEIDVMEALGHEPTKVLGTLHFGGRWPANTHHTNEFVLPRAGTIADFHVYAVEWEPGEIRWSVDGHPYAVQSFWWSSGKMDAAKGLGTQPTEEADLNPWPAPFDQPFYLIMNLSVGGELPGKPDGTTVFPASMVVDYVRVYEKVGGYGKPGPRGEGRLPYGKP